MAICGRLKLAKLRRIVLNCAECVPRAEEKATEGGEKKAGLEAWMDEINGFKIVPDARRNRVVDRPESGDSGEILAPLNARVNVQHRELPLSKLRENPLLQVLLQNLNAHKPR